MSSATKFPWPGNRGRFALALSLISLFFVFIYTDFYIAWIDDLWVDQCLKGHLMTPHFATFFMYLPGISTIIKALYITIPSLPWFGLFALGSSGLLLLNFYYLVYPFLKKVAHPAGRALIAFALFIIMLYGHIYLFNLTSSGISLMGLSLINLFMAIERGERRKLAYLFFGFSFILGSYSRYPMSVFMLGFVLIGIKMYYRKIFAKPNWVYLIAFLLLAAVPTYHFIATTSSDFKKQHLGLLNILDSKLSQINLSNIDDPVLYAKTYALYTWFLGDEIIWEPETLDEIARVQELESNLNDIPHKIHAEVNKARNYYTQDYSPGLNWFWRSICFIAGVLLLLAYHFLHRKKAAEKTLGLHTVLVVIILGGLAATLMYYKMEERVLHPMLLTLLLFQAFLISKARIPAPARPVVVLFVLVLLAGSVLRLIEYQSVAGFKAEEIKLKREVVRELSELKNTKLVLTDLYSTTLFHDKLLINTKIPENAQYLAFKEFWGSISPSHIDQLHRICETDQMLEFYKCLYRQKDEVVFIYLTERVKMLENYFPVVYNEQVTFKRADDFNSLNAIHHSFLWLPLEFGFYTFDDSFEDARQP